MRLPDKHTAAGVIMISSLLLATFIISPNIACLPWDLKFFNSLYNTSYIIFFFYRYLFFTGLIWILFSYNLKKIENPDLGKRMLHSFLITATAYIIYISISFITRYKSDCFTGQLMFQFFVVFLLAAFIGHTLAQAHEQRKKEQEIEQLKVENLQSRYNALTSQINPHFLFNSLNGLTSMIRKKNEKDSLEYVNKLSDVFRYILQSDKKGLVTLGEELEFIKSFFYMMEVRFANKLIFRINVPDKMKGHKMPVLSILPVVENVVVHNTIDSDHLMEVNIGISDEGELFISSPVFPKLAKPETNGSGLKNLENRFLLLMDANIRIATDENRFSVYLPLKKEKNENSDS